MKMLSYDLANCTEASAAQEETDAHFVKNNRTFDRKRKTEIE